MNAITEKAAEQMRRLEAAKEALQALTEQYEALKEQALPQEVKDALSKLELEMAPAIHSAQSEYEEAEKVVKAIVAEELQETLRGDTLMAVYTPPGASWDSKKLEGFALAFPRLLEARKETSAKVTIRQKGK